MRATVLKPKSRLAEYQLLEALTGQTLLLHWMQAAGHRSKLK